MVEIATSIDLSEVFEALPMAVTILSPDAVYLAVNRAYERVAGRRREELIGRSFFQLFPGGPQTRCAAQVRASFERVITEGVTDVMLLQRYDIEPAGRSGEFEERYWNSVNTPLRDADGKVTGMIVRLEEVTDFIDELTGRGPLDSPTERRQALDAEILARARELQDINERLQRTRQEERLVNEQLRQTVEQHQQAVSDTSHDLRGPLAGLRTRLEVALAEAEPDSRQLLRAALQDAERLSGIISDLLELAKLDAGVPAAAQAVDLANLVEAELAHRPVPVPVIPRLDPGVVVHGSPLRLSRLLANLLANAERHARSRIEVSVTARHGQAVLEVTDDGPGIPAFERETVFRRFYRRDDARGSDPGGSGLGLPIAREIAKAHHGSLEVTDPSAGSSGGARLVLRLPLRDPGNAGG